MGREDFKIANLEQEELKKVKQLENELGRTLILYEGNNNVKQNRIER